MEIAFESRSLRDLCENKNIAISELGGNAAEALRRRLSDIQAASSFEDIIWSNRRTEGIGREQRVLIDLSDSYYMIISANHVRNPMGPDGNPKWSAITRVKLICIGEES